MSQNFSAQQSGVVTTTGEDARDDVNLSRGLNISHISTVLPKDVINTIISDEDDPILKDMIDEEFKQLEQEQKDQQKWELEIKRDEARQKAALLWQKRKQMEELKVAEEKRKQQVLQEQEEVRQKKQAEKVKAAKE